MSHEIFVNVSSQPTTFIQRKLMLLEAGHIPRNLSASKILRITSKHQTQFETIKSSAKPI